MIMTTHYQLTAACPETMVRQCGTCWSFIPIEINSSTLVNTAFPNCPYLANGQMVRMKYLNQLRKVFESTYICIFVFLKQLMKIPKTAAMMQCLLCKKEMESDLKFSLVGIKHKTSGKLHPTSTG